MVSKTGTEIVALIPAAGRAARIGPLPCSKEIYPVAFDRDEGGTLRPTVVSRHLFDKFRRAAVTRVYVILRDGKWDIPRYFGDGCLVGVHIAYLVVKDSLGPPDTLDHAYPFVAGHSVAFGFPDILFGPDDVFEQLLAHLGDRRADVVLGLYPAPDVTQVDMVDVDDHGRVRSIVLKPRSSHLRYTWICAVWTPAFTNLMHAFVNEERSRHRSQPRKYIDSDPQGDLPVGAVIKAAIDARLRVQGVTFPDQAFIDIGASPNNLVEAVRTFVSKL
jgi:glucose-1-phosphate thymidylyltransferase